MSIEQGPRPDRKELRELGLRFGLRSEANEEHPDRNEDAALARPDLGAFAVFDGMSRPRGGEIAAQIARQTIEQRMQELSSDADAETAETLIREAIREAEQAILQYTIAHLEGKKIGATATIALFRRNASGREVIFGNVGDSRASILHEDGTLEHATLDDSSMLEGVPEPTARRIQKRLSEVTDLSTLDPFEIAVWNNRNVISNAIGRDAEPRTSRVQLRSGDRIIMATDGVHGNLTDTEIANILHESSSPENASDELVRAAQERSRDKNHIRAKPDDMTAIVTQIIG